MRTVFKTFGIITMAGSLVFGQVAASFALGDKLGIPESIPIPLVPVGPEFQVNTSTIWHQSHPDVAMDSEGNFVVVWTGYDQAGPTPGIYGQRYDHTGNPLGPEFQVNTTPVNSFQIPSVAMNHVGHFVVVWEALSQSTGSVEVFGQRYDPTGAPVGPEFQVNTYTANVQRSPAVAMHDSGNFVITWQSSAQDGSGQGIFAQRYDHTGVPEGPEFQVNTYTAENQWFSDVAMDDDGNFVVVWQSDLQDGDLGGIYGQRYDNTGTTQGPEFQINSHSIGVQYVPRVAMDGDGNFMVVWQDFDQPIHEGPGIFGQRYNITGASIGSEFQVNTGFLDAWDTSIAMDDNGNAWVAWRSSGEVLTQGFGITGNPSGTEFQVNTFTADSQAFPEIAISSSGHAVITWSSENQDGDHEGVFAQRYQPNRAPNCAAATPVPSGLFSNDHAFHVIDIANVWDPDGDPVTLTVNEIYQDEAVNAAGSGFTYPDGKGIGTNAAEVRDEHVVGGNGRTYRIHFTAEDEWGASCSKAVYVQASPQLKADPDWIIYDSTDWPGIVGELLNPSPSRTIDPTSRITR